MFHSLGHIMFNYESATVASILGTSLDAVFTIDEKGRIVDLNSAAVRMFGRTREEFLGSNISCIVPSPLKEKHDGFLAAFSPDRGIKHVLGRGIRLNGEHKDGTLFPVEVGISAFVQNGKRYFTGFVRDMSERQKNEDRMHFLAVHDTDTGLLNYRGFCGSLLPADGDARAVFIRLEEFRRLAAAYNQHWSKATLHEFAQRLQEFLNPGEIAARVREDAFAILFPGDVSSRMESLRQQLRKPVTQGSMAFPMTCTIGVSRPQGSIEQRLHDAQLACDRAGQQGRGRINAFDEEMSRRTQRELQIETQLRETLRNGGLNLALQPKIRLADRQITGAEALVRWIDAELGLIEPSEFIPIAERLGLIGCISDWVLRQSMREIACCAEQSITVAVNLSALDFLQPNLVDKISKLLAENQVDPARLVIELTESVVANDAKLVTARMHEVKLLGASISLDDFGTGYSSLSYLRQFPIDSLKIDISFVRDMPDKADAVAITTAIVAMAKALGLDTIAEGVETEEQADLLRVLKVDLCQGYLFGKPVSPAEFHEMVRQQRFSKDS